MNSARLRIVGVHGSPYSRKLLAALRYRRLPYAWIVRGSAEDHDLPEPRIDLLPRLLVEDGEHDEAVAVTDTTPILRDLDRRYPERRVRPQDAVVALLDALLEDWADEWLTKPMFHYRWAFDEDVRRAGDLLPRWSRTERSDADVQTAGTMFSERQVGRLGVVGSSTMTAPVIEDSYLRALALLGEHLATSRFLLGGRPAACDFAAYGQLTQLTGFDPTPTRLAYELAPRVVAWVHVVEDLSGLEPSDGDWMRRGDVPDTLRALLGEVGRLYVPYLLANESAVRGGAERVECELDGRPWTQRPFPYQARCAGWLRDEYAALTADDRRDADALLAGSGCEALFAGTAPAT